MKLISDIINELIDSDKSISGPLLKTKVLATRLKSGELLAWTDNELNGFESNEELPHYRKHWGNITGNYIVGTPLSGMMQYYNQPLPTAGLDKKILEAITWMHLYPGVSTLESYMTDNDSGRLQRTLIPELTSLIELNMQKMGNPTLRISSATCYASVSTVSQTLSVIKSKLLEFMLKLDDELGGDAEIGSIAGTSEEIKEKIITYMSQTVVNNTGDAAIINTGRNSSIVAEIKINKGDFNGLKRELLDANVDEESVCELESIIEHESPDYSSGRFGPKVNQWIEKMMSKALNGYWQIGIGAAGNLLADVIKKFYGI